MVSLKIAIIPGDGIGKEVVPEGIRALEALAANRSFVGDSESGGCSGRAVSPLVDVHEDSESKRMLVCCPAGTKPWIVGIEF